MPVALDGLNRAQEAAVTHPDGPLVVAAGAGTGKTQTVVSRFVWLVGQGVPAERILTLTFSAPAAAEMRERLEAELEAPYEELHVETFRSFCLRLLQDEALEAGVDPFLTPVTPADRLALLLERIDDLSLREHEIRGNPAPLLASFVARIDRLKDEMISAEDYRAYAERAMAAAESDAERTGAARELEFARLYADHDRLLAERGALDFGDLILRAFQLLHERPHVRERVAGRFQHVLVDEYDDTNFAQGMLLRLLIDEHRQVTLVGADDRFREELPEAKVVKLERSCRSGRRILDAAAAVAPGRKLTGVSGGRVRFWRCRSERAQAQAVAAEAEQLIASGVPPEQICVLVRSVKSEGTVIASALEERALPGARVRLGRVLPASRGARRAGVAARARRPERLRRRRAGAEQATRGAALGGRGSPDAARPPAQARHALGGGRGARGPAALRGGPRPGARVPAPLPLGLERLRGPPAGRVRAAADRAHRAAPPAGVRHARGHGRAAPQHREALRAGHGLHAPRAARHGARLHALPRRGGGVGAARGGGHRHAHRARRAGDEHERRARPRVRPRLRARPVGRAHAGSVPPRGGRHPGRAPQGTPARARRPRGARGRDAPPAAPGHDARPQGPRARLGRIRRTRAPRPAPRRSTRRR